MKTIELHLKAVDFKGTDFNVPCECAVSKAAIRQFSTQEAFETGCGLKIGDVYYSHKWYWVNDFSEDHLKATSLNFDNTTIRTIILTKAE